jgi:hypothetical protein
MDLNLRFHNLALSYPGLTGSLRGVQGSLTCRGQSINAVIKRAKIGGSELNGKGTIRDFRNPKIDFAFSFPLFDTADFEAPQRQASGSSWSERKRSGYMMLFLARSQMRGEIAAPKGKMFGRAFSNLKVRFVGDAGIIKIPQWSMEVAGGRVHGTGLFETRADRKELLRVDFRGQGVPIERVLKADAQGSVLTGKASANGWMAWDTTRKSRNRGLSRQGHFQVQMSDGKVQRFEILSKIFSLINLGSFLRGRLPDVMSAGLPFQRLSWQVDLNNNKWKVKNLKLLSDATIIDTSGMYFSDQKRMNFKVRVAPLVGIDKLLSTVVGKAMKRDVKTLSTTFRVRGLYGSPDIRLIPLDTLKSIGQ